MSVRIALRLRGGKRVVKVRTYRMCRHIRPHRIKGPSAEPARQSGRRSGADGQIPAPRAAFSAVGEQRFERPICHAARRDAETSEHIYALTNDVRRLDQLVTSL